MNVEDALTKLGDSTSQAVASVMQTYAGEAVDAALRGVEITMRAEVSDTHMTVEDVLALKPGDVLRLDGHAANGITLFADQVAVHRARPGRSGRKRAAQVLAPVEDGR